MSNAMSTCSDLATQVAGLLRQDNINNQIYTWLGMTYADMAQRVPFELFHRHEEVTVLDTTSSIAITAMVGTMMAAIFVNGGKLYLARQVPLTDFDRITRVGAAWSTTDCPLIWAIGNDTDGTFKLFIHPAAAGDTTVTLLYSGDYETAITGATILELPYHHEHALIWGTAELGALMVRPPLAQAFRAEYEEALQDIQQTLGYHPDAVPILRSVTGPYTGTPKMTRIGMQNMPETI
jgi:hypothetical protein